MLKFWGIYIMEPGTIREYRRLLPVHFPGNEGTDNLAAFPTFEAAEKGLEQVLATVDTGKAGFTILPVYRAD